eukprot:715706_1
MDRDPPPYSDNPQPEACRNLIVRGCCKFGNDCLYSHDIAPTSSKAANKNSVKKYPICPSFSRYGFCRASGICLFSHDPEHAKLPVSPVHSRSPRSSERDSITSVIQRPSTSAIPPPKFVEPRYSDALHIQPEEYVQVCPYMDTSLRSRFRRAWAFIDAKVSFTSTFLTVYCYKSKLRPSYYLVFMYQDGDVFRIHSSEWSELFKSGTEFMRVILHEETKPGEPYIPGKYTNSEYMSILKKSW